MNVDICNGLINELDIYSGGPFEGPSFTTVCSHLHIGKILCQVISNGELNTEIVLFDSNHEIDSSSPIIEDKTNSISDVYILKFYKLTNSASYTEQQLIELTMFKKTVMASVVLNSVNQAYYKNQYSDPNLGLPNLKCFNLILNRTQKFDERSYLVGRINIKECGKINRLFGPATTSLAIKAYGEKLSTIIDEKYDEVLCTLGGDNFAVIILEEKLELLKPLLNGCPIEINTTDDSFELQISARAGFAKCSLSNYHQNMFLGYASEAMAYSKLPHTPDVVMYTDAAHNVVNDNKNYAERIKSALENDKFMVYFQPVVEYSDVPQITAAEALIRWNDDCQVVNPLSFIPVAEEAGLITKIDFYVLNKVCQRIKSFIDDGLQVVPVSCNFSKYNLNNSDFAQRIIDTINMYQIDYRLINIEFDESAFHEDQESFTNCVNTLKNAGIKVVIDKFGSNLSSLHLLIELDFDFLKIDMNTANNKNPKTRIILESIIHTAYRLGITVICNGVESEATIKDLNKAGCSFFQTDYYDKALSERFFINRLKKPLY